MRLCIAVDRSRNSCRVFNVADTLRCDEPFTRDKAPSPMCVTVRRPVHQFHVLRTGGQVGILTEKRGATIVPYFRDHAMNRLNLWQVNMASIVEQHYQSRMSTLSAKERVDRCAAMLQWTRELLGRQIVAESGPMSVVRLKWEVAKRLYCADPVASAMIERKLVDVSR